LRLLLLAALILPAVFQGAARAQDDEEPQAVQRYLSRLHLGDSFRRVKKIYPPAADWPSKKESRTGVTRYRVERASAKEFPAHAQTLYLGFKSGDLVEIEVIYDEEQSRAHTVEKVAGEYALIYGEAKRTDERFSWSDGKTVLRVFPAEIPVAKDAAHGEHAVAWRTAVQVFDHDLTSRSSPLAPE
jgi:hypothetical protein